MSELTIQSQGSPPLSSKSMIQESTTANCSEWLGHLS